MCGIAGFIGHFPEALLGKFNAEQHHRGPDDGGAFFDAGYGVGLCHRRLSILDLSPAGHQPMFTQDGRVGIVFNGEIYNFRELRKGIQGEFEFKGNSDTEVILYLYIKHGATFVERLNGIFAFAIWDANKKELFVARDGMGVKPFYYTTDHNGFLFASELKCLLHYEGLDKCIDPLAVSQYISYVYCPSPRTMFKSVKKLEPGHAMILHEGKITRKWKFYEAPIRGIDRNLSIDDAVDGVRHYIRQAVERQWLQMFLWEHFYRVD